MQEEPKDYVWQHSRDIDDNARREAARRYNAQVVESKKKRAKEQCAARKATWGLIFGGIAILVALYFGFRR